MEGVEGFELLLEGARGGLGGYGFGGGVEVEGQEGEGFGVVHFGCCVCVRCEMLRSDVSLGVDWRAASGRRRFRGAMNKVAV